MRKIKKCIFCKQDSTNSQSVEHIIPESLGNEELILEKGVVCDKCNNYFSREIEGPILNLNGFKQLRFYEMIESKRGRIPNGEALFCGEKCDIHWQKVNGKNCLMIGMSPTTMYKFLTDSPKMFFTREFELNDKNYEYEISRFLLKIAIEYYVYLVLQSEKLNLEELDLRFDEQLEKLIQYVRVGRKDKKTIKYEVSVLGNYKPMSNDTMVIQVGFLSESNDLIFKLVICNTSFKLNLSKVNL